MIEVPYLTEAQIEARAEALLAAFSRARGPILRPPVPLDDKILYSLGLRLHMDDLHARFGVPRIAGRVHILAALWIEDQEIRVDESLDPEVNPKAEGRYHFSIGHEIGHWELHRHQITAASAEPLLLVEDRSPIVCRSQHPQFTRLRREMRVRMELQADAFGACLLMPRSFVQAAWRRRLNNLDPVFVEDHQGVAPQLQLSLPRVHRICEGPAKRITRRSLHKLVADIASEFGASRSAMGIRLRKLGLILP